MTTAIVLTEAQGRCLRRENERQALDCEASLSADDDRRAELAEQVRAIDADPYHAAAMAELCRLQDSLPIDGALLYPDGEIARWSTATLRQFLPSYEVQS